IPGANCDQGASGSILASCTTQHRDCVEANGSASCGPCQSTDNSCFIGPDDPADGTCRAADTCTTCDAAHRECTDAPGCGDRTCIEANGAVPAHCDDCPADTVEDPGTQACISLEPCDSRDDCPEELGFFCTQLTTQDPPQCRPAPCSQPGEVWARFAQECQVC